MKEFIVTVNGKSYEVQVEELGETTGSPAPAKPTPIPNAPAAPKVASTAPKPAAAASGTLGKTPVKSPMPGTIMDIKVKVGDSIKAGATLCILEAMKMENEIKSPINSVVVSVNVSKGASVDSNDLLFTLE